MIINYLPNILTLFRIFLIPVFIYYLLIEQNYLLSFIIFGMASITDWADGFLARKLNVVSDFGIFFDPLADKFLVLSAFISFLYIDLLISMKSISLWMILIIAFRDLSITLLRIVINLKGDYTLVTTKIAKLKTALQLITINYVLICLILSDYFELIYYLMFLTTVVTLYTGLYYYYHNGKLLIQIFTDK